MPECVYMQYHCNLKIDPVSFGAPVYTNVAAFLVTRRLYLHAAQRSRLDRLFVHFHSSRLFYLAMLYPLAESTFIFPDLNEGFDTADVCPVAVFQFDILRLDRKEAKKATGKVRCR